MRNFIFFGLLLAFSGCASSSFHAFELGKNSTVNKFNVFDKFLIEIESPMDGVNTGVRISDVFYIRSGRDLVWIFNEAYGAPRIGMTYSDTRMRINVVRKENLSGVYESSLSKFITLMEDNYAKEYPGFSINLKEKRLGKYSFAVEDDDVSEYQTVNSYYLVLNDKHYLGIHFEYLGKDKDISEYREMKNIEESIVSSLNIKTI